MRSTGEIVVLILTVTLCLALLGAGAAVAIVEIRTPEADTSRATSFLIQVTVGLVGALLGVLTCRKIEKKP